MARTLRIRIAEPDTKAAMQNWLGRYMWTVHEGDLGLGWGYANRIGDAEEQAWDFVATEVVAEEIDSVQVIRP